jgi:hypothetical protein
MELTPDELNKWLEERNMYLDETGRPRKKRSMAGIELWVQQNFIVAFNYGNRRLNFNKQDLAETIKIFKYCDEINNLDKNSLPLFRFAFASLVHNMKIELEELQDQKPLKDGYKVHEIIIDDEIDPMVELAMTTPGIEYDFSKDPIIEKKIEIFKGPKKPPKVSDGLDPVLNDAAKALQKISNKQTGEKKGIPQFVNNAAFLVDYWLKRLMPEITTLAIIRNLFYYVGLTGYDDISNIDNYIKRGKEAYYK